MRVDFKDYLFKFGAKVMMVEYFVDGLGEAIRASHNYMSLV